MNNNQLIRMRKRLFYSAGQAAADISKTSTKVWNDYEAGRRKIHDDVVEKITLLSKIHQQILNSLIREIELGIANNGCVCIPEKLDSEEHSNISEIARYNIYSSVLATLEAMYGEKISISGECNNQKIKGE